MIQVSLFCRWLLLHARKPRFFHLCFLTILACFLTVLCLVWDVHNSELCYTNQRLLLNDTDIDNSDYERLPDILQFNDYPPYDESIFFHETSCSYQGQFGSSLKRRSQQLISLTSREACAIESAAFHHPNKKVYVLFASPRYQSVKHHDVIIHALNKYENIKFRNVNLWSYANNTPIFDVLIKGRLFKSRFLISHISDFLRYLTLWRWGGLYLDLDTITLRSMQDLEVNYVGAESERFVAAGVLNFAHHGIGKTIAMQCLLDFQDNFSPYKWGNNGPGVITRVLQSICETKNISLMYNSPKRCLGFKVYNNESFYAISFEDWFNFFDPKLVQSTLNRLNNSYIAHFWNNLSKGEIISIKNVKTAYGELAKKHCPLVYQTIENYLHYL